MDEAENILAEPDVLDVAQVNAIYRVLKAHGNEEPEHAHSIEDRLYYKFIKHIAEKDYEEYHQRTDPRPPPVNVAEVARAITGTKRLKFSRWSE